LRQAQRATGRRESAAVHDLGEKVHVVQVLHGAIVSILRTMYCDLAVLSIDRPTPTIIPSNEERVTMKLLHIDSSPLAGNSVSRELTRRIVQQWRAAHPHAKVEHLDLATDAPGHLNSDSLGFRLGVNAEGLSDVQRKENELSEKLVSQFLAADV